MDVSQEEARESLGQIDDVVARTKKMAAYAGADTIFVVWGVIWVLGYLNTHFLPVVAGKALGDLATSMAISEKLQSWDQMQTIVLRFSKPRVLIRE